MSIYVDFNNPLWIISQVFAFVALILSFWAWQVKDKVKLMLLVGLFSLFLAASASFLENYTLGVLFGLAAVRNFVFCYLDWRASKGRDVRSWLRYFFAAVFAVATITSTVVLVYVVQVKTYGAWLEWMICATLIGLIIGNIQKGTHLMRISFIGNRAFNIINHIYFNNVISVIIAVTAISSNLIFYIREIVARHKERKKESIVEEDSGEELEAFQLPGDSELTPE